jgi:hypothetical protein
MARYTTRSAGAFDYSFKEPITNPFEINFTLPNGEFVKIIHLAKN